MNLTEMKNRRDEIDNIYEDVDANFQQSLESEIRFLEDYIELFEKNGIESDEQLKAIF